MKVLASGQAGLFAIQTAAGFLIERADNGEKHEAPSSDLAYHFAACNDLFVFTARNEAEAREEAHRAWASDRAVRLFVILIDPAESPEDLAEVGYELDELLALRRVQNHVEAQIFSNPLPEPFDVHGVTEAISTAPLTLALLQRFLSLQAIIGNVRGAFDKIDQNIFGDSNSRFVFLEEAIDRGCFRSLVQAAESPGNIDSALFDLYSSLKDLENHRAIIQHWTESFERTHHDLTPVAEIEDERDHHDTSTGAGGRQAFERAMQQQIAIVDRIREADFENARRYARELVEEQRRTSSPDHIAKSLTNISQRAKVLEVLDLALQWAREAVEFKIDDALAHTQVADVLMRLGRYSEAHQSLDLAESYGEAGFAAAGRARILRYQGQYADALAAYRAADLRFRDDDDRAHYNLAGIAECLRDLEKFEDALRQYDEAVAKFPFVAALHAGRAATLVDMGRFDEAFDGYHSALSLDDQNVVPRNGIASLYRRVGELMRAEFDFRSIVGDYPFDLHARGGLVATLRDLGRFDEAVFEAEELVRKLPRTPDSVWILVDAQISAGQFDAASATLESAPGEYRYSGGLRTGHARLERAKGHYAAALSLYDEAAREFPSNAWIQVGRAGMLRRLGNVEEALRIYERALGHNPRRLSIRNAIASIYIFQRRFDDALALLTVDKPRTAQEWRNFALHGMLDSEAGFLDEARERFEWGIERCPFHREARVMRAALSRLRLQSGAAEVAAEIASECSGDVTELVEFHARAVLGDQGLARELYERLLKSYLPEPYHELREEIARQFNVIDFPPQHSHHWLFEREAEALLLEAA